MTRYEKMHLLYSENCKIIDFLPRRVTADSGDFFQEVEDYFLEDKQLQVFCRKATSIVLKLLCYYPFEIYVQETLPVKRQREGWLKDKRCETIVKILRKVILKKQGQIDILLGKGNSMISISGGLLSLAVYNMNPSLQTLLDRLVETEGLYWMSETGQFL